MAHKACLKFLWCHTHLWSRAHFHKSHDLLSDLSIEVKGKQIDLLPLEQESKSKLLYNTSKLLLTVDQMKIVLLYVN